MWPARSVGPLLLASTVLVTLSPRADALVLCAPKKGEGVLRIRDECRKNEVQIEPSDLGLGRSSFAVYDANDTKVGELIGSTDRTLQPAEVLFRIDGHSFVLSVFADRFAGTSDRVYFEGDNCVGRSFLFLSSTLSQVRPTLLPLIAVAPPGSTVYLAENHGPAQTFHYNSTLTASSLSTAGGVCDSPGGNNPINARQATPLVDLDTMFTPPFRIQ
jgi:hypothetical protein